MAEPIDVDTLIAAIATSGNIAVVVLTLVVVIGWLTVREDRKLEREARQADARSMAEAMRAHADSIRVLSETLQALRIEIAVQKRPRQ
jgi:hypothetical protein